MANGPGTSEALKSALSFHTKHETYMLLLMEKKMKEKPRKIKGNDHMEMHIVRVERGIARAGEMAECWGRERVLRLRQDGQPRDVLPPLRVSAPECYLRPLLSSLPVLIPSIRLPHGKLAKARRQHKWLWAMLSPPGGKRSKSLPGGRMDSRGTSQSPPQGKAPESFFCSLFSFG